MFFIEKWAHYVICYVLFTRVQLVFATLFRCVVIHAYLYSNSIIDKVKSDTGPFKGLGLMNSFSQIIEQMTPSWKALGKDPAYKVM